MSIAVRPDSINTNNNAVAVAAPTQDDAIARLVEWAEAANAAYELARKLCVTQFVPQQYRGKPEEGTAAILAGAEVGLSPMAALRAFDPIQGTPAPKAITLRAIVQANGHDIRIDESTDKVATVSGRRKGTAEWQTCTWTIERAQQAGFPGKNPNWKSNPTAMLIARATAEVCRWVASDAIMGMPYSSEEIRDSDGAFEPRPAPQRVTTAEILAQADEPVTAGPQPQPQAASEPAPADASMVSRRQQNRMFALWTDLGYGGDDNREARLQVTARILGLPEPPESSSDLTADEADRVIAALEQRKTQQAQGGEQQ